MSDTGIKLDGDYWRSIIEARVNMLWRWIFDARDTNDTEGLLLWTTRLDECNIILRLIETAEDYVAWSEGRDNAPDKPD